MISGKAIVILFAAASIAQQKGDLYVWVETEVRPASVYVTQPVTATLEVGIRKVRIRGRSIEVNLFRDVLDHRASDFSVFAGGKVTARDIPLADSSGDRHQYEVFRVEVPTRAQRVGPVHIGPVCLEADYPLEVVPHGSGARRWYKVTKTRRETARVEAITVEVKEPPAQGRPANFTGAIGQYRMEVSARPTRVEQDRPLTLAIFIEGGPLEGIAGPDLASLPGLAGRFDYTKEELIGDLQEGRKVFRRAIFPKRQGEQTIPPISWSFFDPAEERYVTLASDPITIMVDPPPPASATMTLPGVTDAPEDDMSLTLLIAGIAPNYIDPDHVLTGQGLALTPAWMAILLAPPPLCLIVTLIARRRAKLNADADAGLVRRRRRRGRLGRTAMVAVPLLAATLTPLPAAKAQPVMRDQTTTQPIQEVFEKAQADFDRAQQIMAIEPDRARRFFRLAAQGFETNEAAGVTNGRLEFNLANSYLHAGDLGRAILHYRRAERLNPRDQSGKENIEVARSRCLTTIRPTRGSPFARSALFWHYETSTSERFTAAIVLYVAFWVLLTACNFVRRRGSIVSAIACAVLATALGVSVVADRWSDRNAPDGVVIASDVMVHKGPGSGYASQFEQPLQPGVEFTLSERRGRWWNIELPDGKRGWIEAATAELVPSGAT